MVCVCFSYARRSTSPTLSRRQMTPQRINLSTRTLESKAAVKKEPRSLAGSDESNEGDSNDNGDDDGLFRNFLCRLAACISDHCLVFLCLLVYSSDNGMKIKYEYVRYISYCCPSYPACLISIGWVTQAIWETVNKYSLDFKFLQLSCL